MNDNIETCLSYENTVCVKKDAQLPFPVKKLSVASVHCRICYDNDKPEELIAPCHCKGTVAFVHRTCLETWLGEAGTTTCELCHGQFKTERTPKYTSTKSIWYWLRYGPRYPGTGLRGDIVACTFCHTTTCELCHGQFKTERTPKYTSTKSIWYWLRYGPRYPGTGLRGDIVACTVITPLAVVVTYVCLYSSEYYSQQKFAQLPAARWTSISLLVMIGIMLFGYYLWVYSVIRLHARMWYTWWQRSCVVRYIAPSTISLHTRIDDLTVLVPNNTPNLLRTEIEGISDSESVLNLETVINIETPSLNMDTLSQGEGLIKNELFAEGDEVVIALDPCISSKGVDL